MRKSTTLEGFPLNHFEELWHIGTLELADKGCRGASHEGPGLSVSEHPDAWRSIAKLGGSPQWSVRREGNAFLDVLALDGEFSRRIRSWGQTAGYVQPVGLWVLSWEDEEAGCVRETLFESRQAAEEEIDCDQDLSQREGLRGTRKLAEAMQRDVPLVFAFDFLALVFAERALQLDGVYWHEELAPWNLSAPRGVIFPHRVSQWTFEKV